LLAALVVAFGTIAAASGAGAESYQRISGEGSSWAAGAIDAMRVNVKQFGITVDYNPSGSSAGRKNFLNGTVDFAASDIPFQFRPEDGSAPEKPQPGSYAYIPVTAGGTSFMYNLKINGQRVTNLRLSGQNVAKIFTTAIKKWNDPAIQADNPGLNLPDRNIVPVVRSDGSGSSAQFTRWLIHQHNATWMDYCRRSGRAPACGFTSFYPTVPGMIAQSGDLGIAGYVSQSFAEGAIGYVNYSYALGSQFPVAKVLNAAGFYTEPTPQNVAVSLLKARINFDESSDDYLTQILDDVYTDPDNRNYQLSSYSYFILPTKIQGQFNTEKGKTLGAFTYYAMCQAQQQSASLGYSPLPINLVQHSLDQIKKIPGVVVQNVDISKCNNPTFSPDGTNVLAKNAPQPAACDKQGPTQCATGTGGAKAATALKAGGASAAGGAGPAGARATAATIAGARGAAGGVAGAGGAAATTGSAACDPTLGPCDASGSLVADGAADAGGAAGGQVSTVLGGASGWGSSQSLIVLVSLLTLALVIVPPIAWRRFSGTRA
jgi:phosphate transport system substrate-binding protein